MENVKNLKDTIDTFVESVNKVKNIYTFQELDDLEKRAVAALQLAEVQVAMAGDDLYNAVLARRNGLRNGDIVKPEVTEVKGGDNSEAKASKSTRGKRKTTKKA